jgi:hypothetical protein
LHRLEVDSRLAIGSDRNWLPASVESLLIIQNKVLKVVIPLVLVVLEVSIIVKGHFNWALPFLSVLSNVFTLWRCDKGLSAFSSVLAL